MLLTNLFVKSSSTSEEAAHSGRFGAVDSAAARAVFGEALARLVELRLAQTAPRRLSSQFRLRGGRRHRNAQRASAQARLLTARAMISAMVLKDTAD
jgi:hypothetical protein